jgi:two-component system, sensor histidine kinase
MNETVDKVLILAATQKDADSTCLILSRGHIPCRKCDNFLDLEKEISNDAGAVILAKEILSPENIGHLAKALNTQSAWSFLPIIVLISAGDLALGNEEALRLLKPLKNATFLERPVRVGTLLSVVQAALADRKRQYEVRDLLDALEKSKQEAIAASQAKSAFLANMSHEIRTPLGAVLGFAELLMESSISEAEKLAYMQTMKRNGQLLSNIIDDILDLSKVESGQITLESIELSVNELFADIISAFEPLASSKKIALNIEYAPHVPRFIKTDPVRLRQILTNILSNAVKFTNSGSITIRISKMDSKLIIRVSDTGLGISPQQVKNLFLPFSQADSSITRKYGGTGLGLALSKKLARLLGGDLTLVHSELKKGSTFEIAIQYQEVAQASTKLDKLKNSIAPEVLANRHILLVDDSKDNQVLISRILKLAGAEVSVASDGLEGVETALSHDFDAILMDVQMPRLGGHEATRRLRASGYSKPVIALTAHALMEDRAKCLEAGCNDYLTKPIQRAELIQVISDHTRLPH